ncbi:ZAR1-like protein [Centropristis striata]|uniref:ZAR1-like protein n=1 Tax=Centropristis striata TaxID=184440 RepID=UPI0027E0E622|nr:ZAR1-like protein [Centropristis striata]
MVSWSHGSGMEGFLSTFPPYNGCGTLVYAGPPQGKREGCFMTPQGLNYLELCRAILAQVSPGQVNPGQVRKASTKECGVQVNARVDKLVQCSLGPKTLFCPEEDSKTPQSPERLSPDRKVPGSTPPLSQLRFFSPVSIYSPVFHRRVYRKKLREEEEEEEEEECECEGEAERAQSEPDREEADHSAEDTVKDLKKTFYRSLKGSNFQFLEQRYGFFHCKQCNIRWESAYVWCISGTSKVYYKQLCRKCQVGFNPYRVESILCKGCAQTCCSCEKKQRHINMKRPHRQDLCCRCKGMKLSCDVTFRFKYIV